MDITDMNDDAAIDIVAQHLIQQCVTAALVADTIGWENYPDLGQFTWHLVALRAQKLAQDNDPDTRTFMAAYGQLAAGADEEA